jgi:hypothetical protein
LDNVAKNSIIAPIEINEPAEATLFQNKNESG